MPELPPLPTGLSPIEWVALALVITLIFFQVIDRRQASRERENKLTRLEDVISRVEASRELETSDRAQLIKALADKSASDAAMASECHAGQARSAEALHAFDNAMRAFERCTIDLKNVSQNLQSQCLAHREMNRNEGPEGEGT